VFPEQQFDALTDEFSRVAIIITLGILIIGNIVAQKFFAWRKVNKKFSE
jgi:hypothetical protein